MARKSGNVEDRLQEAEETLEAIRSGQVDALVVQGPSGDQVFTLQGTDHRYRQLVETMNEGALMVCDDGTIAYANARFASLIAIPLEKMIGSSLQDYVTDGKLIEAILKTQIPLKCEAELVAADGHRLPVWLSATAGWEADLQLTCVIITDLSDQKRSREMLAAERLTAQIVEQAAEGIVVCNAERVVVRASQSAHRLAESNPLLRTFDEAFALPGARELIDRTLQGETTKGLEVTRERDGHPAADLLMSAAPIAGDDGVILGCVISFVDITERTALLEQAERANRSKDEFLAMLGHELRNPLAPIKTALDLMNIKGGDVFRRERDIIERQVKHVVMLVGDLLDVSRIAQGKIDLDRKRVDLADIVERAVEAASPLVEERRHSIEVDVPDGLTIDGDEGRLRQVISNLITNAAKYTPRSGRIAVRAARDVDDAVIVVRDNGVGIAPELLPNLFDLFVQGKRTLERAEGGLGLGLAIVRSLVTLHGGSVQARSDGVGKGSEFEVRLPAVK
ncbi:MAG: ATP-binding protein [Kofleriaceae bacterium]